MGWFIGWDSDYLRWKGYGVPAYCEQPACKRVVDRGIGFLCQRCEMTFCGDHKAAGFCERCIDVEEAESDAQEMQGKEGAQPFPLKPEHPHWLSHLRRDRTWAKWRADPQNMSQLEAWEDATQAAKQSPSQAAPA